MKIEKLPGNAKLYCGDCLDALDSIDENSIDSCVTDPPYHLQSIVKRFGGKNAAPAKPMKSGEKNFQRLSRGFMGQQWDGGDIAFRPATWKKVYRVLKPGAYVLAFCGTRTYHRMTCAIEDAGFDIRDCILWVYGSGFPKSRDVGKAIDDEAGEVREIIGSYAVTREFKGRAYVNDPSHATRVNITKPATPEAEEWDGWGTALKPAVELVVVARKPLSEKSVAANVLKWGTGALNIRDCMIGTEGGMGKPIVKYDEPRSKGKSSKGWGYKKIDKDKTPRGRHPANFIHDGSSEVVRLFPRTASSGKRKQASNGSDTYTPNHKNKVYGKGMGGGFHPGHDDYGSTARFFYTPKAHGDERVDSDHPTVKPVDLLGYLIRLVTRRGGTVLDLFAGTGTTGEAAFLEGVNSILIEREKGYQTDIRNRMKTTRHPFKRKVLIAERNTEAIPEWLREPTKRERLA